MRRVLLILALFLPCVQAALLDADAPVTLDPVAMADAWQQVKNGAPASAPSSCTGAWQSAMLEQDEEVARVVLISWLQQQNPLLPLEGNAPTYASAVRLHRLALQGHAGACSALAAGYRSGKLGALALPVSEQKARWFEQRALHQDSLPK